VRLLAASDRTEGVHRQAAAQVSVGERLVEELGRFFRRNDELREQMLELGSRWEPVYAPMLEAAYGAFRTHGAREHRVELATLAEAPVPPEDEL
jgi:hypothetical protein